MLYAEPPSTNSTFSYLLSFKDGEFVEDASGNVSLLKVGSSLKSKGPDQYELVFQYDISKLPNNSINAAYLWMNLPGVVQPPGEFFSWCDLPIVKAIDRIDVCIDTGDNVFESISGASLLTRLGVLFKSTEKWDSFSESFLGGKLNVLETGEIAERRVILPIPCDIFPLRLYELFPSLSTRSLPFNLIFKITLNNPKEYSVRTNGALVPQFNASNFPCYLFLDLIDKPLDPSKQQPIQQQQQLNNGLTITCCLQQKTENYPSIVTASNKTMRSVEKQSTYSKIPPNMYLNRVELLMGNPSMQLSSQLWGNYCANAIDNMLNSFINFNTNNMSSWINLRTGAASSIPTGLTWSLVTAQSYSFTSSSVNFSLRSPNMDWALYPEDIFLDLELFTRVPIIKYISSAQFFIQPVNTTTLTLMPQWVAARSIISQGLYVSANNLYAIIGIRKFTLHTLSDMDNIAIKIWITLPLTSKDLARIPVHTFKSLIVFRDPIYQYADLDRTLRFGGTSFEFVDKNLPPTEIADEDYANLRRWGQDNQMALAQTVWYFGMDSSKMGYYDSYASSPEYTYAISLFDVNRPNTVIRLRADIFEYLKTINLLTVHEVFWAIRFLEYLPDKSVINWYTSNDASLKSIARKYQEGQLPRTLTTDSITQHKLNSKKKKLVQGYSFF